MWLWTFAVNHRSYPIMLEEKPHGSCIFVVCTVSTAHRNPGNIWWCDNVPPRTVGLAVYSWCCWERGDLYKLITDWYMHCSWLIIPIVPHPLLSCAFLLYHRHYSHNDKLGMVGIALLFWVVTSSPWRLQEYLSPLSFGMLCLIYTISVRGDAKCSGGSSTSTPCPISLSPNPATSRKAHQMMIPLPQRCSRQLPRGI